jgi:hypothetical protein
MTARQQRTSASSVERFEAARTVVLAGFARVAAEQQVFDSLTHLHTESEPVVVRHRVLDHPNWAGRVAATTVRQAASDTGRCSTWRGDVDSRRRRRA